MSTEICTQYSTFEFFCFTRNWDRGQFL